MRTQLHWDDCLLEAAHLAANAIALQLKEYAKTEQIDPRGIKVLTKQQIFDKAEIADAQIIWEEGPEDWAYALLPNELISVYAEAQNGYTLSFYNK